MLYFIHWCVQILQRTDLWEIIWWIVLESVQRGTKGIALSYFFIIMLSSFWVMRETLSALRVMSKNTILDKINIYLGMKKERKIEHTAALPQVPVLQMMSGLPSFYVWIHNKNLTMKHFSLCSFPKWILCFLTILWPFLTSSHTLWEMETLNH